MHYREKLDSLNFFIKEIIKLKNKLAKLAREICYSNSDYKVELYQKHISNYSKKLRTNR